MFTTWCFDIHQSSQKGFICTIFKILGNSQPVVKGSGKFFLEVHICYWKGWVCILTVHFEGISCKRQNRLDSSLTWKKFHVHNFSKQSQDLYTREISYHGDMRRSEGGKTQIPVVVGYFKHHFTEGDK